MSKQNDSDSSASESEVSASSSTFNPLKALYSTKTKVPVQTAPVFENIQQFEAAQKHTEVLPLGKGELIQKREQEKEKLKKEKEQELVEKNKQRFAQYQNAMVPTVKKKIRNVMTRMESTLGPLGALKDCVDKRLRIKVVTRSHTTIRGVLHATLIAFDKQWNLALADVLEIWKRKGVRKRKVPPGLGTPVPKGSAAKISHVPEVTETPLGKGVWECTRYIPQLFVRGEHVVIINLVER